MRKPTCSGITKSPSKVIETIPQYRITERYLETYIDLLIGLQNPMYWPLLQNLEQQRPMADDIRELKLQTQSQLIKAIDLKILDYLLERLQKLPIIIGRCEPRGAFMLVNYIPLFSKTVLHQQSHSTLSSLVPNLTLLRNLIYIFTNQCPETHL